jgi:hypothetical protein
MIRKTLSTGIKHVEREAEHSSPSGVEVKTGEEIN